MATKTYKDLNPLELVGEKELDAYQNYVKLTSYGNVFSEIESEQAAQNDYGTRNFNYPMDFCFGGI